MSYTPGPWKVSYFDENMQAVVKAEHIEVATCWHHCVGSIEKEMLVNARLIAAAPEMYEILSKLYYEYDQLYDGPEHPLNCFAAEMETVRHILRKISP